MSEHEAIERLTSRAWFGTQSVDARESIHEDRATALALIARVESAEAAVGRVRALVYPVATAPWAKVVRHALEGASATSTTGQVDALARLLRTELAPHGGWESLVRAARAVLAAGYIPPAALTTPADQGDNAAGGGS